MIVVTGGAGFIGSAVVWELNRQGLTDILIVDDLGTSQKWRNIAPLHFSDYMHHDEFITNVRAGQWLNNITTIFHMGACSSTTEDDVEYLMSNNYHYSRTLCFAALRAKARFINASSASTYGDGSLGFKDDPELVPNLRPRNPYALSKQMFDLWLLNGGQLKQVPSVKFFNVYGPNEYHKGDMRSMVCKGFNQIKETGAMRLFRSYRPEYPDGGQARDFIHVKDCAKLLVWLMEHKEVNGFLNLGSGQARTWNDLAKAVFKAMNVPEEIEYIEMPAGLRFGYQYHTEADMSWLARAGYDQPFMSLEQGVADYVRNYLATDDPFLTL